MQNAYIYMYFTVKMYFVNFVDELLQDTSCIYSFLTLA